MSRRRYILQMLVVAYILKKNKNKIQKTHENIRRRARTHHKKKRVIIMHISRVNKFNCVSWATTLFFYWPAQKILKYKININNIVRSQHYFRAKSKFCFLFSLVNPRPVHKLCQIVFFRWRSANTFSIYLYIYF